MSIVDASNPLVFVRASDLGMTGKELPARINEDSTLLALLEKVRGEAAKLLGFVTNAGQSAVQSPGIPKLTLIAPPADYVTSEKQTVRQQEIDLLGRMMSMQKAHETYALTGAICTICAACIPQTLVWEAAQGRSAQDKLRIGHPDGVLHVGIDCMLGRTAHFKSVRPTAIAQPECSCREPHSANVQTPPFRTLNRPL